MTYPHNGHFYLMRLNTVTADLYLSQLVRSNHSILLSELACLTRSDHSIYSLSQLAWPAVATPHITWVVSRLAFSAIAASILLFGVRRRRPSTLTDGSPGETSFFCRFLGRLLFAEQKYCCVAILHVKQWSLCCSLTHVMTMIVLL